PFGARTVSLERNGALHSASPAGFPRQGRRARLAVLPGDGSLRRREDATRGGILGHPSGEISGRVDDRARQPLGIATGLARLGAEVFLSFRFASDSRLPVFGRQRSLDPI